MGFMQTTKIILNVVAGTAGIIAAILWITSTGVTVKENKESGWDQGATLTLDGADVIRTAKEQTRWSRKAAFAAAIAAFAQAAALFIP
jgi:hypothetical protein